MDFAEQAHKVVDGVMAGNLSAIGIAVGWSLLALAASWLTTKTVKYSAKQSYRGAKWLLVPKPMSELAEELLVALEDGKPELYGGELALGGRKIIFWRANSKRRAKLAYIGAYDPHYEAKDAKYEKVCDKLTRCERKKVLKQATLIRNRLQDEAEARDAKRSYVKAMEIVNAVNEASEKAHGPQPHPLAAGREFIQYSHNRVVTEAVGDAGSGDGEDMMENTPEKSRSASGLGQALAAMQAKEQPKELKSSKEENQCGCSTCVAARAKRV